MKRRRRTIDLEQTAATLAETEKLDRLGGRRFLTDLVSAAADQNDAMGYARHVHEKARLRDLIDVASEILTEAYRGVEPVDDIVARALERFEALSRPKQPAATR